MSDSAVCIGCTSAHDRAGKTAGAAKAAAKTTTDSAKQSGRGRSHKRSAAYKEGHDH
jgi:hypothetical protein